MTQTRPPAKRRNVYFPSEIDAAAEALADVEGHGNVSRLLQDMVRARAKDVIGPNWRDVVMDEKEAAAA